MQPCITDIQIGKSRARASANKDPDRTRIRNISIGKTQPRRTSHCNPGKISLQNIYPVERYV